MQLGASASRASALNRKEIGPGVHNRLEFPGWSLDVVFDGEDVPAEGRVSGQVRADRREFQLACF
jgi:hypothetical protein